MNPRGFLLFDIDGVIRDVSQSYRKTIQETVKYFSNWEPSLDDIDELKSEGIWNNDWDASFELIKRHFKQKTYSIKTLPSKNKLIEIFNKFYFGENIEDLNNWNGFIKNEELIVNKQFFSDLTNNGLIWGFISGAERLSANFILKHRLGLENPPLLAMGETPEKPDPTGLITLASQLAGTQLGKNVPRIGYLGDTVADVLTIKNAKAKIPDQKFISLAVVPPHLQKDDKKQKRLSYEDKLKSAGADFILKSTNNIISDVNLYF